MAERTSGLSSSSWPESMRSMTTRRARSVPSARSVVRPSQNRSSATRESRSPPVRRRWVPARRRSSVGAVRASSSVRAGIQTSLPKASGGGGQPGSTRVATPPGATDQPLGVRPAKTRIIHWRGASAPSTQAGVVESGGVATAASRSPERRRNRASASRSRMVRLGAPRSVSGPRVIRSSRHSSGSSIACSRASASPIHRQGASWRISGSSSRRSHRMWAKGAMAR